jgi:hypothetical protein
MLADGLYARWGRPDVALAQHIGPAGLVAHASGPVTAGSVELPVTRLRAEVLGRAQA